MTCKDCIHYDLCRSCSRIQLGWHGNSVYYVENIEEICKDFKDRSLFIELPPDGVMYGVLNGKPIELSNFISPPKGNELFILSPETVNVPFYKTLEEAEQALKEREENDKQNRPNP